jgi:hypothetical protein
MGYATKPSTRSAQHEPAGWLLMTFFSKLFERMAGIGKTAAIMTHAPQDVDTLLAMAGIRKTAVIVTHAPQDFDTLLAAAISCDGLFSLSTCEALRLSLVSKAIAKQVKVADSFWKQELQKLKPTEEASLEGWHPQYPKRARGERRDHASWFPHSSERIVGFVLTDRSDGWKAERINESGVLEDLFHPAGEAPPQHGVCRSRTHVWIERPLPLACTACGDESFDTYESFKAHCRLWQHKENLLSANERLPPHLVDPRFLSGGETFASLPSFFARVQVYGTYVAQVLQLLRAPMDAGGDENMNTLLDYAIRSVERYNSCAIDHKATRRQLSAARARCTFERVKEVCVEEFAVRDFLEGGAGHGYCRDVLVGRGERGGWSHFDFHGSSSSLGFLEHVTALFF